MQNVLILHLKVLSLFLQPTVLLPDALLVITSTASWFVNFPMPAGAQDVRTKRFFNIPHKNWRVLIQIG